MKHKEIEFNTEELIDSVEDFAAHVQGRKKLTLRTYRLTRRPPIKPIRPKEITALRRRLNG